MQHLGPTALALVLALGAGAAAAQTSGDPARGKSLFNRCSACHATTAGTSSLGPSLMGVVGRKAGSVPGARYSSALKASSLSWTPQTLDRFLADPQKLAPGTTMPIRIGSASERADLIAYLSGLK